MGLKDSIKGLVPAKGKDGKPGGVEQTAPVPEKIPVPKAKVPGMEEKKSLFSAIFSRGKSASITLGPGEIRQFEREQGEITRKLEKHRKQSIGVGRIIKHPVKVLTESPLNILIVTVPAALLLFFIGTALFIRDYGTSVLFTTTLVDDLVVFAILIAIIPVAFLDLRESTRIRKLEEALPNFFRDLAGMNDSGMTLPNAIHLVAQGEYSTLTPFIRRLDNEMSWNTTFIEAIQRFRNRLGTPLSDRSIDLIAKASKAGGDVSEVLRAAARDTYEVLALRTERRNNMLIYVIIVLISFMVFVFVIAILVSTFLSTMATAGSAASSAGAGAASFIGNVDLFFYTRLFSHAAMIQGIFSGLVAGQMGEGRVVAGLKYSAIMLIIAWVLFRFFIS
jgi:flagellar protein FlaJ